MPQISSDSKPLEGLLDCGPNSAGYNHNRTWWNEIPMIASFRRTLTVMLALLFAVYLYLFLLLRPRIFRHAPEVTIIDTRAGEIDINHPPGFRTTIWYQDIERGINVRLLVICLP